MSISETDAKTPNMQGSLLKGKRGLIMGVANNHSIAWGIAKLAAAHGAELAFTYQNDAFHKRLEPLAESIGASTLIQCDVSDPSAVDKTFERLGETWPEIDFVVHALAYSDKSELSGRYINTTLKNFQQTMAISCFSFTAVARAAERMMPNGGSLITMTYLGAERVMPNYNVMGIAKAALEASVRYLAEDLGPVGIRVNGVSAGPMRTLAGSAIADARQLYKYNEQNSPLRRNVSMEEVGGTALYFLSDLSGGVTGEVHHVDSGFHVIGMPKPRQN